jgi:hypothetical protein
MIINRDVKNKYRWHRNNAKRRNILFNLTLEEWCNLWEQSGKWEQRGRGKDSYVMSRIGDEGPYEVGNVVIKTQAENAKEGCAKMPKRIGFTHSPETKAKLSAKLIGNKRRLGIPHTEEGRRKMSEAQKGRTHSKETRRKISEARKAYLNDYCI